MSRLFLVFVFIFSPVFVLSFSGCAAGPAEQRTEEWVSPIDLKYKSKNPELFAQYEEARKLLDNWRGQEEYLINANKILNSIIQSDDKYAPAHREFGRLYIMAGYINYDNFREGSLNPAETSILESIKIEPGYADAYVLLGHLYTNMKRYDEARIALAKADYIGTKSPWLNLNWADLYNKLENYDAAYTRYMKVVSEETSNRKAYSSALSGVTAYFRRMKEYDKANEWYKKQLEYEPESAWNWGNYASFLLYFREDVDGAISNAEKALSIMNYGMGKFTLACAIYTKWAKQLESGNSDKATQALFDKAYSIYPGIDEVIRETSQYKGTKITAEKLSEYIRNKGLTNTTTRNS